jgi:crotonobetainyl-CoA:carnitine CoA-transferase CaiB-like acyl-CoA transferase
MKVIEMASIAAGPASATILAEWGADVIKIEPLEGDPSRGIPASLGITDLDYDPDFDLHNRGKRAIALDLGKPEALKIIEGLVAKADVFVTNMLSAKQVERKLDWGHLSKINPKLIHASISGYGPTGPASQLRSIDHTAFWSRSGMAALLTPKGQEPVPIRRAMGDRITGVALAAGILAAYIEAQRTGRGKVVETSLMRTAIYAVGTDMTMQLSRGRVGSNQPRKTNINPLNSFFPTKDDRWIAGNLGNLENLDILGHSEIMTDPRFRDAPTRRKHAAEVVDILDAIFRERTLAEWVERLESARFTWAPVQRLDEVAKDPQAEAAGAFVDVPFKSGKGTYRGVATPVEFTNPEGQREGIPKTQGPTLGENTDEILASIGYAPDKIAALRAQKIVK